MAEIKEFPAPAGRGLASGGKQTKERPKPEKPADVVDIEVRRKKKETKGSLETNSVLADALDLVKTGQMTNEEIDALRTISEDEKTLLKLISSLFEGLRNKDESIEALQDLIRQLKQRLGQE